MADGDETAPGDEPPAEEQYDEHVKAFFLDLASKGKDEWNAWRRANKDVRVTFAGIDFPEVSKDEIDFSGFEFGDHANFSRCKWRGNWEEIQKDPTNFTPGRANFAGATFGKQASFVGATFGDGASFARAGFGDGASFLSASFGSGATLTGAGFGSGANFARATFGEHATFDGAYFGDGTKFDKAFFKGSVEFKPNTTFVATVSFENARFDGKADFSSRTFAGAADFTNARFYYPPDFDAATNAARIDFTGAHIRFVPPGRLRHWTSDTKIPLRLRALRKIAEETKNHDLERDLYIEERKAERGVYLRQLLGLDELKKSLEDINKQKKHVWLERRLQRGARNAHWLGILAKPDKIARLFARLFWIAVMGVYWALADYGRSPVRPLVCWLILSLIIFPWLYGLILPIPQKAGSLDADNYEQAVQLVARANAVPFVGPLTIDSDTKKFLFCLNDKDCHPIPTDRYQWLVIGQNLISITCFFFFGLALRNYFKIK